MALSGETIDYGPCAFLDVYDPAAVFSSIDRAGRYAYANQPNIAHWNLARLAEALLPLIDEDKDRAVARAGEALGRFPESFRRHYLSGLRAKLGLLTEEDDDFALAREFLDGLKEAKADFTNSFVALTRSAETGRRENLPWSGDGTALSSWQAKWEARLARQQKSRDEVAAVMRRANPVVIPRNHRVEEALAAAQAGDFAVMQRLLDVLADPFSGTPASAPYQEAPPAGSAAYRTFCGT
jgi:uncharacterized protein YdiU (UPF0061 family)